MTVVPTAEQLGKTMVRYLHTHHKDSQRHIAIIPPLHRQRHGQITYPFQS